MQLGPANAMSSASGSSRSSRADSGSRSRGSPANSSTLPAHSRATGSVGGGPSFRGASVGGASPTAGAAKDEDPDDAAQAALGRGGDDEDPAPRVATPKAMMRSKSSPAPGDYIWNDNVNLRKPPNFTLSSPDRSNLDMMLGSWTPASTSLQPRAPDPGEYGDGCSYGRNGKFNSKAWTHARNSRRPCLMLPDPLKEKPRQMYRLKPTVGGVHPALANVPTWSMFGKDRSNLPFDVPTWTPKMSTDIRPGPGSHNLDRKSKWKATTRRGCTWGGRPQNLHPEEPAWLPRTRGAKVADGDADRLRQKSSGPLRRCSCQVCPGPGMCDHDLSPPPLVAQTPA